MMNLIKIFFIDLIIMHDKCKDNIKHRNKFGGFLFFCSATTENPSLTFFKIVFFYRLGKFKFLQGKCRGSLYRSPAQVIEIGKNNNSFIFLLDNSGWGFSVVDKQNTGKHLKLLLFKTKLQSI